MNLDENLEIMENKMRVLTNQKMDDEIFKQLAGFQNDGQIELSS